MNISKYLNKYLVYNVLYYVYYYIGHIFTKLSHQQRISLDHQSNIKSKKNIFNQIIILFNSTICYK